jgi:hypothetical protein
MVDLIVSGSRGGIEVGGTAGTVTTDSVDWACRSGSRLPTEDDPMETDCGYRSILNPDLSLLLTGIDDIESWSENKADELPFSLDFVATWIATPPFLSMSGGSEVLKMYKGTG